MPNSNKEVIVFSGINICKGGALSVLLEYYAFAARNLVDKFELYFLVKSKKLLPENCLISVIEFPNSQKTYVHKLYYEYVRFKRISKKLQPLLWVSLNDCTPSVYAEKRCVYFHNAIPYYRLSWLDLLYPCRALFQKFYYPFFYTVNIHKNNFIIVQQSFFKELISRDYKIQPNKIIINRPNPDFPIVSLHKDGQAADEKKQYVRFIYPTTAQVYKNIHIIIEAVKSLIMYDHPQFKVYITIDGTENRYARYIKSCAEGIKEISLIGYQTSTSLMRLYQQSECLIFPSKIETWGLPLTEAVQLGKDILAIDLPYVHETLGTYKNVAFFNSTDVNSLIFNMQSYLKRGRDFFKQTNEIRNSYEEAKTLQEVFEVLIRS